MRITGLFVGLVLTVRCTESQPNDVARCCKLWQMTVRYELAVAQEKHSCYGLAGCFCCGEVLLPVIIFLREATYNEFDMFGLIC